MVVKTQVIGDLVIHLDKQPLNLQRHVWRGRSNFLNAIRHWPLVLAVSQDTGYLEGRIVDQTGANLRFRGLGREPTQRDNSCREQSDINS